MIRDCTSKTEQVQTNGEYVYTAIVQLPIVLCELLEASTNRIVEDRVLVILSLPFPLGTQRFE